MPKSATIAACCVVALTGITLSGQAPAADGDAWEFRVAPYFWAPAFETTASIGNAPEGSNSTNLLDILNFAFLALGEVRKGRFAILGEFNYLSVSDDVTWGQGGNGNAEASLSGIMAGAALSYRVVESEKLAVDPFAGFRVWSLDAEIDFDTRPTAARSTTVVDPIVGLRISYALNDDWSLLGMANIGGFNVGTEFQWDAIAQVNYRMNDRFDLSAGYRYLSLDLDRDRIDMSASLGGPFIALGLRF